MQADKELTLLVQNLTKEDALQNLDVDVEITVEDLKCLLEIESMISVSDQAYLLMVHLLVNLQRIESSKPEMKFTLPYMSFTGFATNLGSEELLMTEYGETLPW
jgi:hypothetical protein